MPKKTGAFALHAVQKIPRREVTREDYKHIHVTIANADGGMKGGARNRINCGIDMSSASRLSVN